MILEILGGAWRYGDTGGNLEIQESGDTGSIWRYRDVPGDTGRTLVIHWGPGDTGRYPEVRKVQEVL